MNRHTYEKNKLKVLVDGKLLAEYFETGCFGELALVYNAPRAATVRTTEESDLYSLDVGSFRHVLREQAGARKCSAISIYSSSLYFS